MIITSEMIECEKCKHYESYHRYPNPNAVARHYCAKCNEEIKLVRISPFNDERTVWLPKACYFNHYFEESEEYKEWLRSRSECLVHGLACQIED